MGGPGKGFMTIAIWLPRQYPGNSVLWVDFFFLCVCVTARIPGAVQHDFPLHLMYNCPPTEPKLSQFCCDIKDDVQVKARERSACQGAAVPGELGATGTSRGNAITGCRPAVRQWGEWDGCSGSSLVWAAGQCLPDQSQMVMRRIRGQADESGSARHRMGRDLPRHRPITSVAQAKIGACSCECKRRGMRKMGNISKCCVRSVLKWRRKKPLGLFCKDYFSSTQTWSLCTGWISLINRVFIL